MIYKVYDGTYSSFLVDANKSWHYKRAKDLTDEVNNIMKTMSGKWIESWHYVFDIGIKKNHSFFGNGYLEKTIKLYKPKENKKGIRVIYDLRDNFNSKDYILCSSTEEIVAAINKYAALHSLFG